MCEFLANLRKYEELYYLFTILFARRYASAGTIYGSESICVRLSFFSQKGWIHWFDFWHGKFFLPVLYCVIKKIQVHTKIKVLPLKLFFNSVLLFRHGISIIEMCYRLRSRKVDAQSVTNWTIVGQLKFTIPPSFDARPLLWFITGDRQVPSTARFRSAGQLAMADTCIVHGVVILGSWT